MDNEFPEWIDDLARKIAETIEMIAPLEMRYSPAGENELGVELIEIAPGLMEIDQAGPYDGEEVTDRIHHFDLLAAQAAFDEIRAVYYSDDAEEGYNLSLEGVVAGNEVIVLVYPEPFDDAEASSTLKL